MAISDARSRLKPSQIRLVQLDSVELCASKVNVHVDVYLVAAGGLIAISSIGPILDVPSSSHRDIIDT